MSSSSKFEELVDQFLSDTMEPLKEKNPSINPAEHFKMSK